MVARAVGRPAARPAGEVDVRPARGLRHRRARPRQRLDAPSWPWTATASSWPCASPSCSTSAPISRRAAPGPAPTTSAAWPACTRRRPSIVRPRACSPTPRPPGRTAAPAARRRPTPSSASSTWPRASSASIRGAAPAEPHPALGHAVQDRARLHLRLRRLRRAAWSMALAARRPRGLRAASRRRRARRGKLLGLGIANPDRGRGRPVHRGQSRHRRAARQRRRLRRRRSPARPRWGRATRRPSRQIVSDALGVPPERIQVFWGDSDALGAGRGNGGSGALARGRLGGAARHREGGRARPRASPRSCWRPRPRTSCCATGASPWPAPIKGVTLAAVARAAYQPRQLPPGMEPGFSETAAFTPPGRHLPQRLPGLRGRDRRGHRRGARGRATPWSTTWARMVNPLLVKGQIHGGIVQGLGPGALRAPGLRRRLPASSSPARSWTTPCRAPTTCRSSTWTHHEVPTKVNPLGAKGVGEAGTVGALPALMNAVNDALAPARRPPPRHAGDPGARLARDPGGEGAAPRAADPWRPRRTGLSRSGSHYIMVGWAPSSPRWPSPRSSGRLPLQFLLKNELRSAPPNAGGRSLLVVSFPWNVNRSPASCPDTVPALRNAAASLHAARRQPGGGRAGFCSASCLELHGPLLLAALGANVFLVVASTVMGGSWWKPDSASASPGASASIRQLLQSAVSLGNGLLGGYLASVAFGWTVGVATAMLIVPRGARPSSCCSSRRRPSAIPPC